MEASHSQRSWCGACCIVDSACQLLSQRTSNTGREAEDLGLGVEDGCAAEIGLFLSYEGQATLASRFDAIGSPLVMSTLENGLKVSIVVRSRTFNLADLPTTEQINRAHTTILQKEDHIKNTDNLNAMIWNNPDDGGALQVIDVGGVKIEKN
jgi:hypothetical protein